METDFVALRQYLEGAWIQARGDDEATRKIREALDLLIEAALLAERSRPPQRAKVLTFPKAVRTR
jgi:predicted RNase H-like HicB family nuclease